MVERSGVAIAEISERYLLNEAERRTGLSDFGRDLFRRPLQVLVESLREEARLNPVGRYLFRELLLQLLINRLQVQATRKLHPEIDGQVISRPLFVVGLARSGTTFLFDQFAKDPLARSLLFWEVRTPAPPPEGVNLGEADPRIAAAEGFIRKNLRLTTWQAVSVAHKVAARVPEECTWLLKMTFICRAFGAWARVPGYMRWHQGEGYAQLGEAYSEYRQLLQLLQWQRAGHHFVLKSPSHLWYLEGILQNFPDARIVHTHRNLLDVVGSHCSLIALVRYMYSEQVDLKEIGAFAMENIEEGLERMTKARASANRDQFVDVRYDDFTRDPVATVRQVYDRLGYTLTPEQEREIAERGSARSRDGTHSYQLEQFGITEGMVRERFAHYLETYDLKR
jgi:hypothetical protein